MTNTITFERKPPVAIYLVALVFFFAALLAMAQMLGSASSMMGYRGPNMGNVKWVGGSMVAALCLALAGVWLMVREHRASRWLMFAITIYWVVYLAIPPAVSPFNSISGMYFNRALFVLPM